MWQPMVAMCSFKSSPVYIVLQMSHMYLPEHIETRANDIEMKGGYSAVKLLENRRTPEQDTMFGGAAGTAGTLGKNESLLERIRDLHVPLGLVSRRYPPSGKRGDESDADTWLPTDIFDKLESLIFKSKSKDTRKRMVAGKSAQRTLKKHLNK
jgi:hypothetical protein